MGGSSAGAGGTSGPGARRSPPHPMQKRASFGAEAPQAEQDFDGTGDTGCSEGSARRGEAWGWAHTLAAAGPVVARYDGVNPP
ncbi:hypothetical protein GCM10023324_30730 [Streptomyces youssoufiensis]